MFNQRYISSIAAGGLLVASSIFGAAPLAIAMPQSQVAGTEFASDGAYIVAFKDGVHVDAEVAKLRRGGINPAFTYKRSFRGIATDLTPAQFQALSRSPLVKYIEANGIVQKHSSSRPAGDLWGLDRIDGTSSVDYIDFDSALGNPGTDGVYYNDFDGTGVDAYIIDTGIMSSHSEFVGRVAVSAGISTVKGRNASSPEDCDGHGTHVAGTVGGATYGVAPGVTLIPIRVLNCRGSGTNAGVIAGVEHVEMMAAQRGNPSVANMSLGGGKSLAVEAAVDSLVSSGVVVAVSAGNSSLNACDQSPAGAELALTVASSSFRDVLSGFSNWGSCVDIAAPGSLILSAMIGATDNTAVYSGTSMAAPHVAGVAALILDENDSLNPLAVRAEMLSRAQHSAIGKNASDASSSHPYPLLQTGAAGSGHSLGSAPSAPTGLMAAASRKGSVVVTWSQSGDSPDFYWLYQYSNIGGVDWNDPTKFGVYFVDGSAREIRVDADGGVQVQYRLVAFNRQGNSGFSTESNTATPR